ncbi:MAG: CotH kinase family protein [Clostridia bacterium]|nr:CotH kinase family protein [Clostridia bacterium]
MKKKRLIILTIIASVILLLCLGFYIAWRVSLDKYEDTGLPKLEITVDGKISSKESYVDCYVSVTNTEERYELSHIKGAVRGRGNTTWSYPKKPYRLKLDEKISFFGEEKNKSWVLLAMYNDYSLSKDALAFTLGASLENGDYVPSLHYVDLYINGEYTGLYALTEQVNENKGRVDVQADISQEDTEIPFLVEIDDYIEDDGGIEGKDYFKIGDANYVIKYPDAGDGLTQAQLEYVKSYILNAHNLINKKGVTVNELSQYIDVDSFIDYYLVQELMIQTEVKYKSVYMSKLSNGKLKMGPLWDYDWALDGPSLLRWFTYEAPLEDYSSKGAWFYTLLAGSYEFRMTVKTRWQELEAKVRQATADFEASRDYILKGAKKNWLKWYWYNPWADYEKCFEKTITTLKNRIDWLDNKIDNY